MRPRLNSRTPTAATGYRALALLRHNAAIRGRNGLEPGNSAGPGPAARVAHPSDCPHAQPRKPPVPAALDLHGPPGLNWLRRLLVLLATWATVHLTAISVDGCHDDEIEEVPVDVAVVLGNRVTPGGIPSPRLLRRLERAIELHRAGTVARVIVSGGQDPGSPHEADVMRTVLLAAGVPDAAIVVDRGGVDTHATARFTRDYMHAHGLTSVIAVSQFYHLSRCKLALRRFGVPEVYAAHAALEFEIRDPWSMGRELVGYYAYLLRDYGDTPP